MSVKGPRGPRAWTLALVAVVFGAPLHAGARPTSTTTIVIDRTWVCSTVSDGGRVLRVAMTSPKSLSDRKVPAAASITTGSAGLTQLLAGVEAGPASGRPTGGVYYNKNLCRATAKSIPLTARGLPGPPVPFDQSLKCNAGARVLVRVRAVLDRKAAWRASQDILTARGNSSTAAVAVRTETGKPLAFFTFASGKTKLWTAGGCSS